MEKEESLGRALSLLFCCGLEGGFGFVDGEEAIDNNADNFIVLFVI